MRKIKFRAWDKNINKYFKEGWVIYPDGRCEFPEGGWDLQGYYENLETFILQQYTGLHDRNGKEIYEGDIVKDSVGVGEVKYSEDFAAFIVKYTDSDTDYFLGFESRNISIIGSIFENPELLQMEKHD